MTSLEIRSNTTSSSIIFRTDEPPDADYEGIEFICEVQGAGFRGAIGSDTGYRNSPSVFFHGIASECLGWEGEKIWWSEFEVELKATSDRCGHITLFVTLRTYQGEELSIPVSLEAGALADLAMRAEKIFG